jgi:3-carboxy-cis,cis-muconate cycloisomerase
MPQKRNPQVCQDIVGISAEVRALVPHILECLHSEHEADNAPSVLFDNVARACILIGDILERVDLIAPGVALHSDRMRANLDLTEGLISAEAVVLELGASIGRQAAQTSSRRPRRPRRRAAGRSPTF